MNTKKILFLILFIYGQNLYALTNLHQQASQTQQMIDKLQQMLETTSDTFVNTHNGYVKELTLQKTELQTIKSQVQSAQMKEDNGWKKLAELKAKQDKLDRNSQEYKDLQRQRIAAALEQDSNHSHLENLKKQETNQQNTVNATNKKIENLQTAFYDELNKLRQDLKKQNDKLQAINEQIKQQEGNNNAGSGTGGNTGGNTGNNGNNAGSNTGNGNNPPATTPAPNFDADTTTLNSPYGMQLANLNSLNKRMGELRENANANGVWARVFSGLQTTKFGTRNDTFYTTIQGGYDHAFGFNGANNYLGFAISYMNSVVNKDHSLDTLNSNGVEFAIYNAYVQDGASKANSFKNGFYNDSVIKLGYIHTQAGMNNNNSATDSFSFIISNELGYRFLLGETRDFFIDPQLELALAYLDQSVLKQILAGNPLTGNQDAIITLRGRVGSNFGYRFDEYTQDKNFRSEIYLGTYFVGDYITGGKINFTHPYKSLSISPLESTARWTLNLGTNFSIKDNHRIYFDFERSFFGSIITQYQVSLGYRYSFGTSKYTSLENTVKASNEAKVQEVAPTKGYYIKLLDTTNPSKKQNRILSKIEDLKTQNNGNTKAYLVGPFTSFKQAKTSMDDYKGMAKELNSQAEIIEVE